jgi:DNA-binding Lrp family transcriptional regulator
MGSEKALIDELKTIDGVIEVMGSLGVYDIIAKIKAEDDHKLREIITWKIRKMNNIKSTLTLLEIEGQG